MRLLLTQPRTRPLLFAHVELLCQSVWEKSSPQPSSRSSLDLGLRSTAGAGPLDPFSLRHAPEGPCLPVLDLLHPPPICSVLVKEISRQLQEKGAQEAIFKDRACLKMSVFHPHARLMARGQIQNSRWELIFLQQLEAMPHCFPASELPAGSRKLSSFLTLSM